MKSHFFAALFFPLLATAQPCLANEAGPVSLSPMIGGASVFGFTYGGKAAYRILNLGFLDKVNDQVSVEVSAFKGSIYLVDTLYMSANMRWDFQFANRYTAYVAPGIAYIKVMNIPTWLFQGFGTGLSLQIGGFWHYSDTIALRAEFDSGDSSLRFGSTFKF